VTELPAIYRFAGHINAEEAPMEYHYNDFVDFVNGQDRETYINHDNGWCGCAIGDFVQENCDTREDDVVERVLDLLFTPLNDGVDGRANDEDIYAELNHGFPETYGELADMIAASDLKS
jgi:hypothetical protein